MLTTHGVAEGEWDGNEWIQYRWSCKLKDSDVLYWIHLKDLTQLEKEGENIQQEQPIQVNTLTWKDINNLERIINNVHYEFRNGIGEKSFGEEVLERFREERDEQEQPKVDLVTELRHHLATTPREQLEKEWKELEPYGNIGPSVQEFLYGKQPEVDLEKFAEKIKNFQGRYKHPESISIKAAMAFMARLFYQYPNVARMWYDSLPKATMD